MATSDSNASNPVQAFQDDQHQVHYKVDKRYRDSDYFLNDQLQYAESVQEFRSIRDAITKATAFNLGKFAFNFMRIQ